MPSATDSIDPAGDALAADARFWVIHCDGSAVPNPGRMGLGAVVADPEGTPCHRLSEAAPGFGCNNEAELRSLQRALEWLARQAPATTTSVRVFSDSSVLVAQLAPPGRAVPPIARLAPLFDELRLTLQAFAQVDIAWLPRHRNRAADALAREALGLPPKPARVAGRPRRRR
jgi:ribonuclease HI